MKPNKIILLLLLCINVAFAQVQKISTNEAIQTKSIQVDDTLLAKAEIYEDFAELHFLDSETQASISIALELNQFDQIAEIVNSYGKDTDLYKFDIPGAQFCIRFKNRQANLFLLIGGGIVHFPELNKVQLRILFKR